MTKFKKGQRVIAVGTIVSPRGEFSTDHAVVSFSRDDDHDGFAGSAQCAEIALKDLRPTPQASSEIREALTARRQDFWNILARWDDDESYSVDDAIRDVAALAPSRQGAAKRVEG